jgi:hypothetical protein
VGWAMSSHRPSGQARQGPLRHISHRHVTLHMIAEI